MTAETHPDRRTDLVGAVLERRYRVDSLIARGGMSSVYRGLDTRLDRPVALKVMDARYSGDRSFTERFEREARAAARLHHPDIVAVYDQGVDRELGEDHVYLVMQLVEGATLRDLIRERGGLPLPVAVRIMESVLSALAAAHDAGLVHRDIKPENVLIGADGSVKVTDFGLVRAAASAGATSGSIILGTVAYLSPEQVTTGAADTRTDVYAAGIVLYEMLTGEPPYTGDTALSVAYRHVNDDVPAPGGRFPELPPAVDDLVLRATRRDAAMRPPDATAFGNELRLLRESLSIPTATMPVPAGQQQTVRTEPCGNGPPTDRLAPVASAVSDDPAQQDGPRGTRALTRPASEAERTRDMAAVDTDGTDGTTEPERSRRRGRKLFAISTLVILVLAGLVGGTAWWLGSGRYIEVPRIAGQPVAAAKQALRKAQLDPKITHEYHNSVPANTVISASPEQGARVLSGATVELLVSRGRPRVPEIPPGTPVNEAQSILRNAKLAPKLDSAANRYHPSVPKGRVIEVRPAPGTPVAMSTAVTIVVSKGPRPVPVPDVRGMSRDQAFATLRQAGFDPYEADRKFAENVARNHVISTKPAAGDKVLMRGTPRVGVVLSNTVTVPNLSGTRVEEARKQLTDLGLKLEVRAVIRENGRILGQYPFPGSKVKPGTTVTVTAF